MLLDIGGPDRVEPVFQRFGRRFRAPDDLEVKVLQHLIRFLRIRLHGLQALVPTAKIGHIGLYRDEETHEPHEYYCKLPSPISERLIVVTDPMLATGGSAVAAVDFIKQHGGKKIKFMAIIAAPEGVERLMEAHPDIQLYVGHIDRELNKDAYICPGLGDAGDRIFGTK